MHKPKHSDPVTREPKPALEGLAVRARFKRLTTLGWPSSFPIVQFPNAPLIVAFVAGEVAGMAHGSVHAIGHVLPARRRRVRSRRRTEPARPVSEDARPRRTADGSSHGVWAPHDAGATARHGISCKV